jgi:hypothetical protein
MSEDKDKIRDMVMALARGDHEAAREASAEVMAAKSARAAEQFSEKWNSDYKVPKSE